MDRDKVLKHGVKIGDVYKTLQTFMGGPSSIFSRFPPVAGLCASRANTASAQRISANFNNRGSDGSVYTG
jgi:hypothetical protein